MLSNGSGQENRTWHEDDPLELEVRVGFFEQSIRSMAEYILHSQNGETALERVSWVKALRYKKAYNHMSVPEERMRTIEVVLEATERIVETEEGIKNPLSPPPKFRLFKPEDWQLVAHLYKARSHHEEI